MENLNNCIANFLVPMVMINCMCIGFVIKSSVEIIENKYIPLIVSVFGVLFNVWFNHWNFTPQVFLEGFFSGLASTGTFELIRNMKEINE